MKKITISQLEFIEALEDAFEMAEGFSHDYDEGHLCPNCSYIRELLIKYDK